MPSSRSLTPILAAAALVVLLAWPVAASASTTRVQDDDARLRYSGSTKHVAVRAASSASRRSLYPGASLEASFTGTAVTWVGPKAPGYGSAQVFIDGSQVATVSAVAGRIYEQRALFSASGLPDGFHSLEIRAIGSVAVDALEIEGDALQPARPQPLVRIEQTSTKLAFSDFFRQVGFSAASGGNHRLARVPGASVTLEFSGNDVAWLAERGPAQGRARVTLDGVDRGVVSLWSPVRRSARVVFSRAGLSDGPHTLKVTALGTKDGSARGTDISIDAFDIAGTAEQATTRVEDDDRRVRFAGAWRTISSPSGRTTALASRSGASASLVFRGTGVALRATVGPRGGKAGVYVDSVLKETVDLYADATERGARVFSIDGLTDARHTVTVRATGAHNAESDASEVALDAFEVDGDVVALGVASGHRRADVTDKRIVRSGVWAAMTSGGASGGSALSSSKKGSRLYLDFTGTGFTWYATRHAKAGRARINIDGKAVTTISLYSRARADQRVVFLISGLKKGRHKVVIEVLGTRESASKGAGVSADVIDVTGVLNQASRPSPFSYHWRTYIVIDKSECNLYWVKNGSLVKVYRCAVGKHSTPTPNRTWRIGIKYHTDPGGIYGPRKMRLFKQSGSSFQYTAYGIHGTNQPWVIGTWASHGCIRMLNSQILELFPQVPVGTMVVTKD